MMRTFLSAFRQTCGQTERRNNTMKMFSACNFGAGAVHRRGAAKPHSRLARRAHGVRSLGRDMRRRQRHAHSGHRRQQTRGGARTADGRDGSRPVDPDQRGRVDAEGGGEVAGVERGDARLERCQPGREARQVLRTQRGKVSRGGRGEGAREKGGGAESNRARGPRRAGGGVGTGEEGRAAAGWRGRWCAPAVSSGNWSPSPRTADSRPHLPPPRLRPSRRPPPTHPCPSRPSTGRRRAWAVAGRAGRALGLCESVRGHRAGRPPSPRVVSQVRRPNTGSH